jgi:hypothetical protein
MIDVYFFMEEMYDEYFTFMFNFLRYKLLKGRVNWNLHRFCTTLKTLAHGKK